MYKCTSVLINPYSSPFSLQVQALRREITGEQDKNAQLGSDHNRLQEEIHRLKHDIEVLQTQLREEAEKNNQLALLLDKEKRDTDTISSKLNRVRSDRQQEQARWEEERKNTMKLLTVANEKLTR
jgi:chromosome segregation ATPase